MYGHETNPVHATHELSRLKVFSALSELEFWKDQLKETCPPFFTI